MQAIVENSRAVSFHEGGIEIARLEYPGRFSSKASIKIGQGIIYEIIPVNFWRTVFAIQKNEKVVTKFRRKWIGTIEIEDLTQGKRNKYTFRQKGLIPSRYVLSDKDGREMAAIRPEFRWKGLRHIFEIQVSDSLKRHDDYLVKIILAVYLTRAMMRRKRTISSH